MVGAGAVQILPVGRLANSDALIQSLSGGNPVVGRIVADGSGLALSILNHRLPLPAGTQLAPGTPVEARLVLENGSHQLRIQTRTGPQSAAGPTRNPALAILEQVIATLTISVAPEQAAALAPDAGQLPAHVVRAALELLVGRERMGLQFARLAELIDSAVAAGRLPAEMGARLRALARRMQGESAEDFHRLLLSARDALRGAASPRPALAPARDPSIADELVALRDLVAARRETLGPAGDALIKSLDALIQRFDAGRMQNVRGFELPYQFLEIPLHQSSGFDRAQVHFFGDESGRRESEPNSTTVVLDLELSRLGSLWIMLHAAGGTCRCVIRASSDSARRTLEDASPLLEAVLRSAGYSSATVQSEPWDGDRIAALSGLSRRFAGFEAIA
jgi:hypothetical protein